MSLHSRGVYYDQTTGLPCEASGGVAATGSITFTSNPVATKTVTLNGTAITFVASGATTLQCNLGPTLGDTLVNLAAKINGGCSDTQVEKFKALAYPVSPGGAGQDSGANQIMLAAVTVGVGNATPGSTATGNSIVFSTNVAGTTVTGSGSLAGGSANTPTAVPGAAPTSPI